MLTCISQSDDVLIDENQKEEKNKQTNIEKQKEDAYNAHTQALNKRVECL